MNAEEFEQRVGRKPDQDDLERVNCTLAGSTFHTMCGWCAEHEKPRFQCGCKAPYAAGVKK